FVAHAGIAEASARRMRALCVSFGTGLQLVNVLKDRADDGGRGVSWLPGGDASVGSLMAKTLRHLEEALEYTATIPRRERRLRLFCLWPLLMAAETLALLAEDAARAASGTPGAPEPVRVKITR